MIVGICGLIGSGKDTIASYLIDEHGFRRMSFAESLKDAVAAVFGWDREMLDGVTKSSRQWREQVDTWWSERLSIPNLTPRIVLQHWGTELFRNHFHDEIWVASVERKLMKTEDNIVITDCRFKNEIDAIHRSGGIVVRVKRGPEPSWYEAAVAYNSGPKNMGWALARNELEHNKIHASEYSHCGLKFDAVIENDSTIDDLHKKINSLLEDRQPSIVSVFS